MDKQEFKKDFTSSNYSTIKVFSSKEEVNSIQNYNFFPGLTHFFYGDILKGSIFFGLGLALISTIIYGATSGGWNLLLFSVPALMGMIPLYLISYMDQEVLYKQKLREVDNKTTSKELAEIERNHLLSLYVPGLGQLFSGETLKGMILLIGTILAIGLPVLYYSLRAVMPDLFTYKYGNVTISRDRTEGYIPLFATFPLYLFSIVDSRINYMNKEYELSNNNLNMLNQQQNIFPVKITVFSTNF